MQIKETELLKQLAFYSKELDSERVGVEIKNCVSLETACSVVEEVVKERDELKAMLPEETEEYIHLDVRVRLEGMIAENKQREIAGHSMAYGVEHFDELQMELRDRLSRVIRNKKIEEIENG